MTDKEELSRGEALAKVAVLEDELAELRGRVSVPSDRDALLYLMERFDSEESNCPVCGHSEATSDMDSAYYLREYLAAAPAPVERCDTCYGHGEVPTGETQRFGDLQPPEPIMMACPECDGEAPVERVEREAVAMLLIDDASAEESGDWDIEPIPAAIEKLARNGGATLPLYTAPQPAAPAQHSDDVAVDRFAAAMKAKLAAARAKGRSGWDDPAACSVEYLAQLLRGHLTKGNAGTFEDVANFCMMLHQRGANPAVLAPTAAQDVAGLVDRIVPRIDAGGPNPINPEVYCCEWTLHRERERIHSEFADALAAHHSGGAK